MGLINAGIAAYWEYEKKTAEASRLLPRVLDHKDALFVESYYEEAVKWEEARRKAEDAKKRMQDNLDKAIHKTQLYYGIHSRYGLGPIVNGPLKDESTAWSPGFLHVSKGKDGKYEPGYRVHEVSKPKPWRVPKDKQYVVKVTFDEETNAVTSEDGNVDIGIDLFLRIQESIQEGKDRGPRQLARTLIHEAAHFDELVSTGWKSEEEDHYLAWKTVYEAADALEMSPAEKERSRRKMAEYKLQVDLIKRGLRKPTPSVTDLKPRQVEIVQEGLRDEFLNGVQPRLKDIERQIADLKTRLSQESRRRDQGNQPALSMLTAVEFKDLVTAACGTTPGLVETRLAGMRGKQWLAGYDGYKAGMEIGMGGCSRELWDMFMSIRARIIEKAAIPVIDPTWFDDWFLKTARKTYAYHHPPPLGVAAFMVFAKKACARPGSVAQEDILELEDMSFPNPRMWLSSSDSFPSDTWPNACPKILYDDLARLNNTQPRGWRLNVSWVNWRAEQLVRQYANPDAPRQSPQPPQGPEPEQRNDRIDVPTLDDILRRLDRK